MNGEKHNDRGQDHEVGIEKDQDTGVVKAPAALQAAGGFSHAPGCDEQCKDLPVGTVKVLDAGKAGQSQARGECAQGEKNSAGKRFMPQAEDGEDGHNLSEYRGHAE